MPTEFRNEPFTDFSKEENAQAMRDAIAKVSEQLGREYPLVIGGERIETGSKLDSFNPANRTQVVGSFQKATKELANQAVEKAAETFETWKHTPAEERAEMLFRVAAIMRERKHEFSAWMVYEVAKTWAEADGDTAEAIDFCEFYGREMLRYAGEQPLVKLEGEDNELEYIPLGVGAVIPPWNFPLAIMAGMTVAAVVTGNTVVLKPSSDAPTIAFKFFEILEEAGLPPGVVNFMTGSGAEVGDVVVDHPKTRFIAFTGSKEVGLRINERPRRSTKARSGSSASWLRWAARTRSSWPTTRIWKMRRRAWCSLRLVFRGRSVRHARARSSMRGFTTRCSTRSSSALRRSNSADPSDRRQT